MRQFLATTALAALVLGPTAVLAVPPASLPSPSTSKSVLRSSQPPRLACLGNSQSFNTCSLTFASPWFWDQVRNPRLWDWNYATWDGTATSGARNIARSGNHSGPHSSYAGSNVFTASNPDTNSALSIAALKAVAPDITLNTDGITNDSGSVGLESYNNIKAAMLAVGAPRNIIMESPPRDGSGDRPFVNYHNSAMRYWAQIDPSVIFVPTWPYLADETTTGGVIGGSGGVAGAVTNEGLHYSLYGARAVQPELARAFDLANVPRTVAPVQTLADIYNASTNIYGNLLGTRGAMGGTAGTNANGYSTGSVATSWTLTVGGTGEVTVAASKCTFVLNNVTHVCQQLDFTATTALTSGVLITFAGSGGGFVQPAAGYKALVSANVENVNTVGLIGFQMVIAGSGMQTVSMGTYAGGYVASTYGGALIMPVVDEFWQMLFPGTVQLGTSGAANVTFNIQFNKGTAAGSLGSIRIADVIVKPQPVTLP